MTDLPDLEHVLRERLQTPLADLVSFFDRDGTIPEFFKAPPVRDYMLHVYAAGVWTTRELRALGFSEKDIGATCFASGQLCTESRDPWRIADETIERARAGLRFAPGEILAECIRTGSALRPMEAMRPENRN